MAITDLLPFFFYSLCLLSKSESGPFNYFPAERTGSSIEGPGEIPRQRSLPPSPVWVQGHSPKNKEQEAARASNFPQSTVRWLWRKCLNIYLPQQILLTLRKMHFQQMLMCGLVTSHRKQVSSWNHLLLSWLQEFSPASSSSKSASLPGSCRNNSFSTDHQGR